MIFFFSSRRRHTRYWRDWSSDVCSSDLGFSKLAILKNKAKNMTGPETSHWKTEAKLCWSVWGMDIPLEPADVCGGGTGRRLHIVKMTYRMWSYLVLFFLRCFGQWICIIKYLFVRIMCDYAEICELCDQMWLLINCVVLYLLVYHYYFLIFMMVVFKLTEMNLFCFLIQSLFLYQWFVFRKL